MAELMPPAAWLLVAALLLAVVPRRVGDVLLLAAPVVALAHLLVLDEGVALAVPFYGLELEPLRVDRLSLAFGYVFCIAGLLAALYGLRVMGRDERVAAMAYAGSALGVAFAGDLVSLFVFWELKALGSVFLVFARRTAASGRAGMRYLYMQLAGGKVLLAGVVWHAVDTGSIAFTAFEASAATVLILVGFMLSAAVPPLHPWLPDAYPNATVAGTVFLSAYTTKAAVYALARGFAGYEALVWFGVVMALYGVVFAILENDIRRLLSYHIVSQVGFMVAAIGVGTELAVNGATAHAFAHILYKGLLLMGVGAVLYAVGETRSTHLGGLAGRMKGTLLFYMVGAVSIAGVPLFSGFVSKEMAVAAASLDERALVVILLKIASVGTFLSVVLKLPHATWFGPDRQGHEPRRLPMTMLVAMGAAAAINLLLGLVPGLLYAVLPHPVDFEPYTLLKVAETSQILLFTAVGYVLALTWLKPKAGVSLDVDWLYRALPFRVATAAASLRGDRGAEAEPAERPGLVARFPLLARAPLAGGHSPVYPTWMLGACMLAVSVVILGLAYLA